VFTGRVYTGEAYTGRKLRLGMRGIPVSEKYRGIKSDGIIYRGIAKYRGIPSGGSDFQ